MLLPTVKIKSDRPKGYRIINESSFDPAVHERFDAPPVPVLPPLPPVPAPPVDPLAALPANWQKEMPAADVIKLAATVTGRTPENRKQAVEMVAAKLAERK